MGVPACRASTQPFDPEPGAGSRDLEQPPENGVPEHPYVLFARLAFSGHWVENGWTVLPRTVCHSLRDQLGHKEQLAVQWLRIQGQVLPELEVKVLAEGPER